MYMGSGGSTILAGGGMLARSFNREDLQRLASGDRDLENEFVRYFGELLRIRLESRFREQAWIDDVRQETLLRVLKTIKTEQETITNPEKIGYYVNSVCRNVVLERFRGEGRYAGGSDDQVLDRPDPSIDLEAGVLTAERQKLVRKLLDELSLRDRAILTEVFITEEDKDDICARHEVDRTYLRVLLFRARQRFKDLLLPRI